MAGIGFRLKKALADETYSGLVQGYFFAAIVAAGPWIFAIISINVLAYFVRKTFSFDEFQFFSVIITYGFAFTLIAFGCLDTVITRYLSDKLYFQEKQMMISSFFVIWIFLLLYLSVFAVPFYYFCEIEPFFKIVGFSFYLILGSIWLAMIFLSAARKYVPVVLAFIIGGLISFFGGKYLGLAAGIKGVFLGYLIGMASIFYFLILHIYREFSFKPLFTIEWLGYFKKYPSLVFIGLFLNLGLWIDKILFAFSKEDGEQIVSFFYSDVHYGSPIFVAYLTMIPALTVFLVRIETSFYVYYKKFFLAIDQKKGLVEILKRKEELISSLKANIGPFFKVQAFVSGLAIIFAPQIIKFCQYPATTLSVFRIAVLGIFLQTMTIIMGILLLYLLEYKIVVFVYFVFFATNFLLTELCFKLGFSFWGYGFSGSTLIAWVLMYYFLTRQLEKLDYATFFGQPLVQPKMYKSQIWEPTEALITPSEIIEKEKKEEEKPAPTAEGPEEKNHPDSAAQPKG